MPFGNRPDFDFFTLKFPFLSVLVCKFLFAGQPSRLQLLTEKESAAINRKINK